MIDDLCGVVIHLNAFGAIVRLDDGDLASVPAVDVEAHRATYERAHQSRTTLRFVRRGTGRHAAVMLVPEISDAQLDEQIAAYMKSTQSWESSDGVPAHERHFLKKKRRAVILESKNSHE